MPDTTDQQEQLHEHDGALWKPLLGCTTTFDELLNAQQRWMEIFHETSWNPWREDELKPEVDHVERVMEEWTRGEPDWRPPTKWRIGAINAAITRKVNRAHAADEARWERDKARYDPEREKARYALLERESIHASLEEQLAAYRGGKRFPSLNPEKRSKDIADLEAKFSRNEMEIARLTPIVADREDVVDEDGKLPRDRRKWNLIWYRITRRERVEGLMQSTSALRDQIKATKDRSEKSRLKTELWFEERRLNSLLAVPILAAEAMCADCYTPWFQHVSGGDGFDSRPCPRWPLFAAQMEKVWDIMRSASERAQTATPEPEKPQPLATLSGNLPIADVIERLSDLQKAHPDAVVKRGRANRWELWPGAT